MKPYVICHMCTTIDGKILTSRWPRLPGPKSATELYETTAAKFGIDAWLVGTSTMREFAKPNVKLKAVRTRVPHTDHVADPKAKSFAIGTDGKGVLRFTTGKVAGDHIVVLVTKKVSNDYLAHLKAAGVSFLFCGAKDLDLKVALDKIRRLLKQEKLMLEGGGTFNGAMLQAGLVDEISQVIVPVVDGGTGIPCIFDIPGKAPKKAAATLELRKRRKLAGGATWLRYRVKAQRPQQR